MAFWTLLIFGLPILFLIWKLLMKDANYFKDRGVPHEKYYPIFGSHPRVIMKIKSFPDFMLETSQKYAKNKFYGVFSFGSPRFIVHDPESIRKVGIKDFDHFVDHEGLFAAKADELFAGGLINLKGQKWRDMRSTLSPAFTGSKMRMMYQLVNECGIQWNDYFLGRYKNDEKPLLVDMKDALTKLAVDIISSCAFGLQVNTLKDSDNEFYKHTKNALDFTNVWFILKFLLLGASPKLVDMLGISLSDQDAKRYFKSLILDTIKQRKATNGFRPDVIQLLMQAKEGKLTHEDESNLDEKGFAVVQESEVGRKKVEREWTDSEIAAQAFLFLVAGFDTVSTALQFASYELALNKDVQERLTKEIDGVMAELDGDSSKLTYERLQKMEYLDAVISETLRKFPPGFVLDRVCEKPYILEDEEGRKVQMEKGAKFWINVIGLHYKPKYFPNPERFDPERFMGENKHKIQSNTYLPFGIGPRNCIGSRFALMEAKAVIFHTLSKFTLEPCDETPCPMRFGTGYGFMPERKIVLEFRPRNTSL